MGLRENDGGPARRDLSCKPESYARARAGGTKPGFGALRCRHQSPATGRHRHSFTSHPSAQCRSDPFTNADNQMLTCKEPLYFTLCHFWGKRPGKKDLCFLRALLFKQKLPGNPCCASHRLVTKWPLTNGKCVTAIRVRTPAFTFIRCRPPLNHEIPVNRRKRRKRRKTWRMPLPARAQTPEPLPTTFVIFVAFCLWP